MITIGTARGALAVVCFSCALTNSLFADDALRTYFDGLRSRGLLTVAESYAQGRLADPKLDPALRTELTVELSKTYAARAIALGPPRDAELWQLARQVLTEAATRNDVTRGELLRAQLGLIAAAQATVLRQDAELSPYDEAAQQAAQAACDTAIETLTPVIAEFDEGLKEGRTTRRGFTPYEFRQHAQALRIALAEALRDHAAVLPADSPDRASDLLEARQMFQTARAGMNETRVGDLARLGIADITRRQRDFANATKMYAALSNDTTLVADLRDGVDAGRVRVWLDQGDPLKAAEFLLEVRHARPTWSGELWLTQLMTLQALRQAATTRGDKALADELVAESETVLTKMDEQAGPPWTRWARMILHRDETQRTFGPELERLVQRAKSEYLAKRPVAAIDLYAEAILKSRSLNRPEVTDDLAYTRGSILLEMERFDDAVKQFEEIARPEAKSLRAAAANLLAVFALGRLYEKQKTQSRRETYTAALRDHLQRFADDPTANDARFMFAALEEQRLQATQALPLYLGVPMSHPRGLAAFAGAARCGEVITQRLRAQSRPAGAFHRDTRAELDERLKSFPIQTNWSPEHGDALLAYGRFLLRAEPPDYSTTDRLLDAVLRHRGESPPWDAVCAAALPLRLTTLAGTGQSAAARTLLDQVPVDPPQTLLAVVLGLDQLTTSQQGKETIELSRLFDDAVQRLAKARATLTAAEQMAFDLAAMHAALRAGRWAEAKAQVEQLAKRFSNDVNRQRALAESLAQVSHPEALRLAKAAWQRVEKMSPDGSAEWHAARMAVIAQCLALREFDEAEKWLKMTRLLQEPTPAREAEWNTMQARITEARKTHAGERPSR
ncbi:MAG TPA: hypothetical protein VFG20_01995 [Planctomycetaceae bacterium]|nr:hypothetical protein [Planctomycetaceae bacterium]